MSPWLFHVFMDKILREAKGNIQGRIRLASTMLDLVILFFADHIFSGKAKKKDEMQRKLNDMKKVVDIVRIEDAPGQNGNMTMVSKTEEECNLIN